ncbi:hypothetical protein HA402_008655 [Bradysia odoriphaga]|nr:hypothetical protein HA402_008655 [Bradysia odoriphaga]
MYRIPLGPTQMQGKIKKTKSSDRNSNTLWEETIAESKVIIIRNLETQTKLTMICFCNIPHSQKSICLALYTLSLDDVKNALTRAKCRGVQIRIITTEESMKNLSRDFTRLSTSGIAIRFPLHGTERLLHHKLCIIDGEDRNCKQSRQSVPVLLSGSMNWTMSSFTSNWDNITIDSDYDVVKKSQREFDSMWDSFNRLK